MKEDILKISDNLKAGRITEKEAKLFLLFLFGIVPRYSLKKYNIIRQGCNYYILDNMTNCIKKNYIGTFSVLMAMECNAMNSKTTDLKIN